jgi:hypothetical protein
VIIPDFSPFVSTQVLKEDDALSSFDGFLVVAADSCDDTGFAVLYDSLGEDA